MKFELEMDEMNMILSLLNETPTKMGFYPICQKLATQGNVQNNEAAVLKEEFVNAE